MSHCKSEANHAARIFSPGHIHDDRSFIFTAVKRFSHINMLQTCRMRPFIGQLEDSQRQPTANRFCGFRSRTPPRLSSSTKPPRIRYQPLSVLRGSQRRGRPPWVTRCRYPFTNFIVYFDRVCGLRPLISRALVRVRERKPVTRGTVLSIFVDAH